MSRRVVFDRRAERQVRKLSPDDAARVSSALTRFAETGLGDIKPLEGQLKGSLRLRTGPWRIVFRYREPDLIVVTDVVDRGHAY